MKQTAPTRLGWMAGKKWKSAEMDQLQLLGKRQKNPSLMADLAVKGSTVAIAADDDPMYDFYLLKVTSEGVEELESDYTDDHQCTAFRGEKVLKGNFYLRDNIHDMTFTLDIKRRAVVYAATVRHLCAELPTRKRGRKTIYKLPLKENEEIIASL